jgi:DNA primase
MLAFRESGYTNAVGLGSAKITEAHLQQLKTDNYIFCQDMDRFGMSQRTDLSRTCFFKPEGKDPYEAWQKHGRVDIVKIGN